MSSFSIRFIAAVSLVAASAMGRTQKATPALARPLNVPAWVMAQHLTHEVRPMLGKEVNERLTFKVMILSSGDVTEVSSGVARAERLYPEVVDAIPQCKYRPYSVRGVPVEVQTRVVIEIDGGTGLPQRTSPEPNSSDSQPVP